MKRAAPHAWEIASFAASFAVAASVALALLWAGTPAYRQLVGRGTFVEPATGRSEPMSLDSLATFHEGWVAYVTGRSEEQPAGPWFTASERRHMSDVRAVFIGAQALAAAALVALFALGVRARLRGELGRLARAGAAAAAAAIVLVGAAAALAFDAAFLLFHQVLFPQGNFLFAPGSNLLVIYPGSYWYGITLRIVASLLVLAALIASLAHVALRRPGGTTVAAAIVTQR